MIYTIGHSNYTSAEFIEILRSHRVEIVVDIRSEPYSRRVPQFNKRTIERTLNNSGIKYIWKGKSLGGLQALPETVIDEGIEELIELSKDNKIIIMCSEREYIRCHRHFLIAKQLIDRGESVMHISGENIVEINRGNFTEQKDLF